MCSFDYEFDICYVANSWSSDGSLVVVSWWYVDITGMVGRKWYEPWATQENKRTPMFESNGLQPAAAWH